MTHEEYISVLERQSLPETAAALRELFSDSRRLSNFRLSTRCTDQQIDLTHYIQSIIASVKPDTYADDVSEDGWKKLKADVAELFHRLTIEYQTCLTGYRMVQDPSLDMELEEFRMRAEVLWLNIRGKRYHVHERQALLDILAPHSDVLIRLFGIDSTSLVDELDKILAKLTLGLADSVLGVKRRRMAFPVLGRRDPQRDGQTFCVACQHSRSRTGKPPAWVRHLLTPTTCEPR